MNVKQQKAIYVIIYAPIQWEVIPVRVEMDMNKQVAQLAQVFVAILFYIIMYFNSFTRRKVHTHRTVYWFNMHRRTRQVNYKGACAWKGTGDGGGGRQLLF